jgi:hypothetical protein
LASFYFAEYFHMRPRGHIKPQLERICDYISLNFTVSHGVDTSRKRKPAAAGFIERAFLGRIETSFDFTADSDLALSWRIKIGCPRKY